MADTDTGTKPQDDELYGWLLHPLSTTAFEEDIYERRWHVVKRDQPRYFSDLLTAEDLDRVIGTHAVSYPEVSVVGNNGEIDSASYTNASSIIEPLRIASHFDDGATIVFRALHRHVPTLARLAVQVGRRFGSRLQTNVYLTPVDAQGFAPHWDTHDVFVLQVDGSKQWTIYDTPVKLPLRGQKFDPQIHRPGSVSEEFELRAGDVAYIPRGVMHAARSTETVSLHITLGITAFTWADFLIESVAAAALKDVHLRENLPAGFTCNEIQAGDRVKLAREKLEAVLADLDTLPVWNRLATEATVSNQPLFSDLLTQRLDPKPLALEARVKRRADIDATIDSDHDSLVLTFSGQEVRLPAGAKPAVMFIIATEEFTVSEMPDCLDPNSKLTLVNRLIREGLLVPVT